MRAYEVTGDGIVVGRRLSEFTGLLTAVPELREQQRALT